MKVSVSSLVSWRLAASLAALLIVVAAVGLLGLDSTQEFDHEVDTDAPPPELAYSSIEHLQYTDYRYERTWTRNNSTDCGSADVVRERGWVENSERRARFDIVFGSTSHHLFINSAIQYQKDEGESSWDSVPSSDYSPLVNVFFGHHEALRGANVVVTDRTEEIIVLQFDRTNKTQAFFNSGIWGTGGTEQERMDFYLDADTGRIQRVERTVYGHNHRDYCEVVTLEGYGSATADRPNDIGFRIEEVVVRVVKTIGRLSPFLITAVSVAPGDNQPS